jgi:hypothetical protein
MSPEDVKRADQLLQQHTERQHMNCDYPQIIRALSRQEGGAHYKNRAIQPIEYIHANDLPFIEGSVVKYITRWRDKGGVEDLKKIKHYIDLLIELEACKTARVDASVQHEIHSKT